MSFELEASAGDSVCSLQEAAQCSAGAVRPACRNAFERALLRWIQKGGTGKEHRVWSPSAVGAPDVDGPDFAFVTKKNETKGHRRGSITKASKLGAQDA